MLELPLVVLLHEDGADEPDDGRLVREDPGSLMGWTAPAAASLCAKGGPSEVHEGEPSAMQVTTIGLDLAKNVLQRHGVDGRGRVALRKRLPRARLLALLANLPPCVIGMEACGGAHPLRRRRRRSRCERIDSSAVDGPASWWRLATR
jgi:hypothetical protein